MDKTRTKPSFIKPAKDGYANLKEEILDLHDQVSTQGTDATDLENQFVEVKKQFEEIKTTVSNVNSDVVDEVTTARGIYPNLNERLDSMSGYDLLKMFERLTTNKQYIYDDQERITNVIVRGDVNYDIAYIYDAEGNIQREERHDLDGNLIAYKDYGFDAVGQIVSETGLNTDEVLTATTSLITDELNKRLTLLESIDFVKLAADIGNVDAENLWDTLQEIRSRLQHLEEYLPENQGQLIELSSVLERLDTLEHKLDTNYVIYSITANSSVSVYPIPDTIPSTASVFLEGLLLVKDQDYIIADSKITFLVALIDDFIVSFKY